VRRSFSEIEVDLRRAVLNQSYSEVERLALLFCEAVEAHVRVLPPGDPSIPEIAAMVQEVLEWSNSMVRSDREILASQLKLIPKVKPYLPVAHGRTATLQLDV
jgi:hypothetical protein